MEPWPQIDPGELNQKITIEQLTQGVGEDYGEPTEAWTTWATPWAKVITGPGREFWKARQITAEVEMVFRFRYVAGLKPTMRISYDSKIFEIIHTAADDRKCYWTVLTKARQE